MPWAGASISWIEISAAAAPNIWWWGARAGAAWARAQGRTIFCCGLEAMAMLTLLLVVARAHGCSSSRVRAHTHQHAYFPKNTICTRMTPHGSAWTAHGQRWAPCTGHRSRRTTHTSSIRARTSIRTRTHRTASAPRSRYRSAKKFLDRDDISAFSSPIILVPSFFCPDKPVSRHFHA